MNWRECFLRQARSDHTILQRINTASVEQCHKLHYLQMATEKLAKGILCDRAGNSPPPTSHSALVRMLQTLKMNPEIREGLGFSDAAVFRSYIDSLLDLARKIERLAPAIAGRSAPNPEYPWEDPVASTVIAPVDFDFEDFDPKRPQMAKFYRLIHDLLRIVR